MLIVAAIRNQGPLSLITGSLTGNPNPTTINSGVGAGATSDLVSGGSTTVAAGSSRAAGIKAKTIAPIYVSLKNHPNLVMDKDAAASLTTVEQMFGHIIPLSGASRSYAEQAANYALHPERFAPPGKSLHEVGLALDVGPTVTGGYNNPALVGAFTAAGWFRAGKSGNWEGHGTEPEPWHWSYGVPG